MEDIIKTERIANPYCGFSSKTFIGEMELGKLWVGGFRQCVQVWNISSLVAAYAQLY